MVIARQLGEFDRFRLLAPFDGWGAMVAEVEVIAYHILGLYEHPVSGRSGVLLVTTAVPGVDADMVGTAVTGPLESALSDIAGVQAVASLTEDGRSRIAARLDPDNPEAAIAAAREIVSRVAEQFPPGAERPTVLTSLTGPGAVLYVSMIGDAYALSDLAGMADTLLQDKLAHLPDVAKVRSLGARSYTNRIWLDPERLSVYGLTAEEVGEAMTGNGTGVGPDGGLPADGDLSTIGDLVVKTIDGVPVRLGDVARIEHGPSSGPVLHVNGRPAVAVGVVPAPGAIGIVGAVCAALDEIRPTLPQGVEIEMQGRLGLE
jgi:multidrug efflux pump